MTSLRLPRAPQHLSVSQVALRLALGGIVPPCRGQRIARQAAKFGQMLCRIKSSSTGLAHWLQADTQPVYGQL